MKFVYPRTDF